MNNNDAWGCAIAFILGIPIVIGLVLGWIIWA